MMELTCGNFSLDLSSPAVMGILNLTPDSFSDGGRFPDCDSAISHALAMVNDGAAIIDIGGESTRPGAASVSVQQELDRLMPVVESLVVELPVPVSVDTSKPEVMRAAISAGAGMINDVMALRSEGAVDAVRDADNVALCLMHMQGAPRTMQQNPRYSYVVTEVRNFLLERALVGERGGIAGSRLLLDPGVGVGPVWSTFKREAASPASSADANMKPEVRVSMPMRTLPPDLPSTRAAAQQSLSSNSGVTLSSPTLPRMPSVPK
mgnify:CR=1 FL=1